MSHWVPIKYISEKYQIDENYICNLIVRKVVTSSQIGRKVKLIDEDSFISYLDLHKEIEDKKEIIAQLRDTDRMLEVELRACNETHVAFEVQQRILFRVYRAFVQAFSLFIRNEEERGIFLSLSMGERLDLIASKYSHTLQTTLKIYKNTVDRICKKSFNFIEEQRDNVTKLEKLNRNMREVCARLRNGEVRQRAKCDPKLRHKECESAEVMRLTKLSTKLRYELSKERDTVKILQIRLHDFENEQLQKIEKSAGGGEKSPIDLLKGAGVDMSTTKPVEEALSLFGELIGEMEELMKEKFLLQEQLSDEKVRVKNMQMKLAEVESALSDWKQKYSEIQREYRAYVAKVEANGFKYLMINLKKWIKNNYLLLLLVALAVWVIYLLYQLFFLLF